MSNITGLATIVGNSSGVNASQNVVDSANHSMLMQQFTNGQVLRGTVLQRTGHQQVSIQTDMGNVTIHTELMLKRGDEVALKFEPRAQETSVRIISVNGQSLAKYIAGMEGGQSSQTQDRVATDSNMLRPSLDALGVTSQGQSSAATLKADTLIRGVFLSKPAIDSAQMAHMPQAMQTALSNADTGTSFQVRITNILMPSPSGNGYLSLSPDDLTSPSLLQQSAAGTASANKPAPALHYTVPAMQPATGQSTSAAAQGTALPVNQSSVMPNAASQAQSAQTQNLVAPSNPGAAQSSATPTQLAPAVTNAATSVPADVGLSPNTTYSAVQPGASGVQQSSTVSGAAITPASNAAQPSAQPTQPNAATQVPTTPADQPLRFEGTVIQSSNPRELLVQSPLGSVKFFVTSPLPKGTILNFELQQAVQVRGGDATFSSLERATATPQSFEAMEDIAALMRSAPLSPSHASYIVPRPGPTLSTEMVFILTAMAGGDLRKWLGDDGVEQLQSQGKQELLARLGAEFASLKSLPPSDARDGVWHHSMIPIYAEEQVTPIHYFVKRGHHESGSGDEASKDTDHFMVDVSLSTLGHMQLDGLIQKQGAQTQFDLLMRTEHPWDTSLTQSITLIYERAQQISGFKGSIGFRHGSSAMLTLPVDKAVSEASNTDSIIV